MDAWAGLNMQSGQPFLRNRLTDLSFSQLKQAYVKEHGYTISVPQWDDIIRLKPTLIKTPQEIKEEKKRNLTRILASPAPEWYGKYASIMTWVDNIQDTASILYPMLRMLVRWSPKVFSRFIPYAGWMLLGYDILQLINTFGRAPLAPMMAKRSVCSYFKQNPFGKKAQLNRIKRIHNWVPTHRDLLQVFQVTADWTGVGLQLGSAVGFIYDSLFGAYRYVTGEKVTFNQPLPELNFRELQATKALPAAAIISSAGQVFDELTHFWTYATWAMAIATLTPALEESDFSAGIEDPRQILVDAPTPTDPVTLEVIREAGLSIDAGVGWPVFGDKQILLKDHMDFVQQYAREAFRDYCFRHSHDSYGLIAAQLVDGANHDLLDALEPDAELVEEETPIHLVMFAMIKAPLLPDGDVSPAQWAAFQKWVDDYTEHYEHIPKISDIKDKFDILGIPWKTAYPATLDPAVANLFPADVDFSPYD